MLLRRLAYRVIRVAALGSVRGGCLCQCRQFCNGIVDLIALRGIFNELLEISLLRDKLLELEVGVVALLRGGYDTLTEPGLLQLASQRRLGRTARSLE